MLMLRNVAFSLHMKYNKGCWFDQFFFINMHVTYML